MGAVERGQVAQGEEGDEGGAGEGHQEEEDGLGRASEAVQPLAQEGAGVVAHVERQEAAWGGGERGGGGGGNCGAY